MMMQRVVQADREGYEDLRARRAEHCARLVTKSLDLSCSCHHNDH